MKIARKSVERAILISANINSPANSTFGCSPAKMYQQIQKYYGKWIIKKTDKEAMDQLFIYFTKRLTNLTSTVIGRIYTYLELALLQLSELKKYFLREL